MKQVSAGDESQLFAAGRLEKKLDRALRLACLEQGCGEVRSSLRRVEAAFALAEVDAFLCSGECEVHVPAPQGGGRAADQGPAQRVRVAQQTSRLDSGVEQLRRLGQLPPLAQQAAERRNQEEIELPLAGGADHDQGASGVGLAGGI